MVTDNSGSSADEAVSVQQSTLRGTLANTLPGSNFYINLPSYERFADTFTSTNWHAVPDNWDLVCLRVNSNEAYTTKLSQNIGAVAIAAIVAAQNALPALTLPTWVHEAGCTLLAPASERETLNAAMSGVRTMAKNVYGLTTQISIVPVSELPEGTGELEIARYAPSNAVSWATLRGTALLSVESRIQRGDYWVPDTVGANSCFDGYKDRWHPVASTHGRIVSIIIRALRDDIDVHAQVYSRVLDEVASLTQVTGAGCPLGIDSLVSLGSKHDFATEVSVRDCGENSGGAQEIRNGIQAQLRKASSWRARLGLTRASKPAVPSSDSFAASSDFMSFCGSLRMTLDLRHGQLRRLREILQAAEDHGHLLYGIHTSESSIVRAIAIGDASPIYIMHGSAGGFELASRRIRARQRDLHIEESV